jgi:hypothetical protein
MDVDDFKSPEVGIAAATTALVLSPAARRLLRKGAVYGVAGVLLAGEALLAAGRGATRGYRTAVGSAGETADRPSPAQAAGASKKKRTPRKKSTTQR